MKDAYQIIDVRGLKITTGVGFVVSSVPPQQIGGWKGGEMPGFRILFSFPCAAHHKLDWPCEVVVPGWQPTRETRPETL